MKTKIFFLLVVLISGFTFSSCERKSGRLTTTSTTSEKVEVGSISAKLMPGNYLDNNLLQSLKEQRTIQNSMEVLGYSWSTSNYEKVSYYKKHYDKFFVDQDSGMPSPEQKIIAYEVKGAKTVSEAFYALPTDSEWKWLTQNQVVEFVLSNRGFIRHHNTTIVFFCKKDENKVLYERNLISEMIAITIDEYDLLRVHEMTDPFYNSCIVIIPQRN